MEQIGGNAGVRQTTRLVFTRWAAIARWSVPVVCGLGLAMPSTPLPGDNLGIRRFRTPPLGSDVRLGQSFRMPVDGLRAIDVLPVANGTRPSGDILFELYEVSHDEGEKPAVRVRSTEVLSEDLMKQAVYRFEFPPILDSKDRAYRLDLVASPASGIAFWATRGERYAEGSMHVNGRPRWADLVFQAHAPTLSVWAQLRLLQGRSPERGYLMAAVGIALMLLLPRVLNGLGEIGSD